MPATVTIEDPKTWKRVLNIQVPAEDINSEYGICLKNYRKKVNIPGFRPGKAPLNLIEKKMGDSIRAEAVENIIQKSVQEAFKQNDLTPISRPKVESVDYKKGGDLSFKAEIEIDPIIRLKDYQGLADKLEKITVQKEEVDKALEDIQERMSTLVNVSRGLEKGDFAQIEYKEVKINGELVTDFNNPQHPVEIGKSSMESFNTGLIGAKAGELRNIEYHFPQDYSVEKYQSAKGFFQVFIKEVKEKILPKADQELAKSVGNFKSIEDLITKIREDIFKQKTQNQQRETEEKTIVRIIEKNPFEVPESQIHNFLHHDFDYFAKQYPQGAINWEDFCRERRPAAEITIKKIKIVDFVAKKEGIKAYPEEVDERIKEIAAQRNEDFEKVKRELRQKQMTLHIREEIKEKKVLDFLIQS